MEPKESKNNWQKIKESKDEESGEWKELWKKEMKGDNKYPYRFQVIWQWNGCQKNTKTMWDENKALRLYECININGWGDLNSVA